MSPRRAFVACIWGAFGGLAGSYLGFATVLFVHRGFANPNDWLKGANGPAFFDLTLSTAIYYACLGGALANGRRRISAAGLGVASVFITLASPLALATRVFSWGSNGAPTLAWYYLILWSYRLANVCAIAAVCGLAERVASARAAAGGLCGVCLAAVVDGAFLRWAGASTAGEGLRGIPVSSLLSGAIWGCAIAACARLPTAPSGIATSGKLELPKSDPAHSSQ